MVKFRFREVLIGGCLEKLARESIGEKKVANLLHKMKSNGNTLQGKDMNLPSWRCLHLAGLSN